MKAKMYDRIDIFLKSLLSVYDIVIGLFLLNLNWKVLVFVTVPSVSD